MAPLPPKKLSRTKIELFLNCSRCFWLDVHGVAKRPPPPPYTINSAIDWLLKKEFDVHRENGTRHPVMEQYNIDCLPYDAPEIDKWRHNFTGVQHQHEPSGFLVTGAVDDVWTTPKNELVVVDYKATGAREHKIYDSYKRQMEVYQWLLRQNGYTVSPTGYFVFARANKEGGFGMGKATLGFDLFIEPLEGNSDWVDEKLMDIRTLVDSGTVPDHSAECAYCTYVTAAAGN
jgi:hypothetical protein